MAAPNRGCNGHPAFPTPSSGEKWKQTSGASRREIVDAYPSSVAWLVPRPALGGVR